MDVDLMQWVHDLHHDTDKAKPAEWEADWADAPLPYKLYRRLPVFELSAEVPLTFEKGHFDALPDLRSLGHWLWYGYGIAQVSRFAAPVLESEEAALPLEMCRRVVASGGGLYPNELYVYLKLNELPEGVYHYDAAHHRLILLREGNYDDYLSRSLGQRCDAAGCFGMAMVSTMFWKNFFKYFNFSYRLQGLDAGVMMGQLLETAKRFGYSTAVYYQFLDRAVNHLPGLSGREENVYALIALGTDVSDGGLETVSGSAGCRAILSSVLCAEVPEVVHEHHVRSQRVKEYPQLLQMNEASMQESTGSFRLSGGRMSAPEGDSAIAMPAVDRLIYDLAAVSRNRYSPETDFVLRRVEKAELAGLLRETAESFRYRNDLDGTREAASPRLSLYGCFYGVEGIENGAYRYDSERHCLIPVRPGDHRHWLQYGMTMHNVNLSQVPLCFHVTGDRLHERNDWGARGYRIQQMEAGMLVQRLLLAAAAIGMGGRPLLGFDAGLSDELYGLAAIGQTALIQIPVGPYRRRSRFEGSLHR